MKTTHKAADAAQRLQEIFEKIDTLENGKTGIDDDESIQLYNAMRDATTDISEYLFERLSYLQAG